MEQGDRGPWRTVIAGALLLLVVLGAYLLCSGSGELAPPSPMPQVASVSARDASSSVAIGGIVEDRDSVVVASSGDIREEMSAEPYPAWHARVHVIDDLGQGLADALVRWMPYSIGNLRSGPIAGQMAEATTDQDGYVVCEVKGPMARVGAEKSGCSTIGVPTLFHQHHQNAEVVLVLPRPILLHGIVRRKDGTRAAKAVVTVVKSSSAQSFSRGRDAPEEVKCTAGDDGCFEVLVQIGWPYRFQAAVARGEAWPVDLVIPRDAPQVELVMRGGITVSGAVLGPDGKPAVDATIYAWRDHDVLSMLQGERLLTHTVRGNYKLVLPEFGSYQVAAVARDSASGDPVAVTVDAAHPHGTATLRLEELGTIRGRVVGVDGTPQAEASVSASVSGPHDWMGREAPANVARFGQVEVVRSAADGTFAIRVHPGASWDLSAWAAPDDASKSGSPKRATVKGARAGDAEVQLILGAPSATEALSKTVLQGVVTRSDGRAMVGCTVSVASAARMGSLGHAVMPDEQGRFMLPAIETGRKIFVALTPHDLELAPQEQGPILVGAAPVDLRFCLTPWGQLPVQVVDAAGTGIPGAHVRANQPGDLANGGSGVTDANGLVTLPRCMPGNAKVSVSRVGGKVFEQQVQVVPGANAVLFVRLP